MWFSSGSNRARDGDARTADECESAELNDVAGVDRASGPVGLVRHRRPILTSTESSRTRRPTPGSRLYEQNGTGWAPERNSDRGNKNWRPAGDAEAIGECGNEWSIRWGHGISSREATSIVLMEFSAKDGSGSLRSEVFKKRYAPSDVTGGPGSPNRAPPPAIRAKIIRVDKYSAGCQQCMDPQMVLVNMFN